MTNVAMNPIEKTIGIKRRIRPRHIVASQLKIFTPVGTAMSMLVAEKNAFFSATSMLIAVPTGVKIFNWLATMWRGRIRLLMPMVFSIGFIATFVIGGLTGVSLAVVPLDRYTTDFYYG